VFKPLRKILYRLGPRFPEDVQFAKRILREQVTLLSRGEAIDQVAPQMMERLQPFNERGYSHLRIQVICAAAKEHLLIEKLMLEQRVALS
jgi:hypothetical protein